MALGRSRRIPKTQRAKSNYRSGRAHSSRFAASSSYQRTPDRRPGQAPVSKRPDWIPCQAGNDGPEQRTIPQLAAG